MIGHDDGNGSEKKVQWFHRLTFLISFIYHHLGLVLLLLTARHSAVPSHLTIYTKHDITLFRLELNTFFINYFMYHLLTLDVICCVTLFGHSDQESFQKVSLLLTIKLGFT